VSGLDGLGVACLRVAAATGNTRLGGVGIGGEVAVEPVHGNGTVAWLLGRTLLMDTEKCAESGRSDLLIVPHAEDQNHLLQRLAHGSQAADGGEVVVVAEDGLLLLAEVIADVVDGIDALDGDC